MPIPLPFSDQYACRNEIMEVYAADRRGQVEYKFNNLGYRNDIDYQEKDSNVGVYIGSSITAGIGVDWKKSFVSLNSASMQVKPYHFAQGCKGVDNREILRMLESVLQSDLDAKYFVIQFINLDRIYDPVTGTTKFNPDRDFNTNNFLNVFDRVSSLLENRTWCFFGCDAMQHSLPATIENHASCVSWNPPYIDHAGVGEHPGTKWHNMISLGLTKRLKQFF